jgi:hypothetical protein
MYKLKFLWLLVASLILAGCAPSLPLLTPPTKPILDRSLAQPCPHLVAPDALDYDAWQVWVMDTVLREYGLCAAKHKATVEAWPK